MNVSDVSWSALINVDVGIAKIVASKRILRSTSHSNSKKYKIIKNIK